MWDGHPLGDMFSRFLQAYGAAIGGSCVARPGGEKYRSRARMIFLLTAKPERAALHARAQSRNFAVKNRRNISFLYEKCRPPPVCISFLRAFLLLQAPFLYLLKMSSVTSAVSSAAIRRNSFWHNEPFSTASRRSSQSEVSAASAIFMPLNVS